MTGHSIRKDKKDVSYHYDVGNDFYKLFLGNSMVYSCAYFKTGTEDIDQAQENKLEYICRKLRLKSGERLLDIGCGWGGLIVHAAKKYGVRSLGITLSREQYEDARERIKREDISELCSVKMLDYRELKDEGPFDKIASIAMFEQVGLKNLPLYFTSVKRALKDGGLFLNHGISVEKQWMKRTPGKKFLNTYVFPGGELCNIAHTLNAMEECGFEVLDVEPLREHYARTLRLWVDALQASKDKALQIADQKTYRIWLFYMAASSNEFEKGTFNVYQTLVSNKSEGFNLTPLTREDLYL